MMVPDEVVEAYVAAYDAADHLIAVGRIRAGLAASNEPLKENEHG